MTEIDDSPTSGRSRRRRRPTTPSEQPQPERPRCCRDGCRRYARQGGRTFSDYPACSFLCAQVAKELGRAQRVCEATGDTEHWQTAVALNDALTTYLRSDTRIYRAAEEVGFSREQWHAIKDGTSAMA